MAVRRTFNIELHDVLGSFDFSNTDIKNALINDFNALRQEVENSDCPQLKGVANQIEREIANIPVLIQKDMTPLHIAELLRLIVGNAKPGTYSDAWHSTFDSTCTPQSCVDQWMAYLLSWGSRDKFIIEIARTTGADNQLDWVKYLLKEYEYCISGWNAHRHGLDLDIEHFFGTWQSITALVNPSIFIDEDHYNNRFRNSIGNKLVLDSSLNRGIRLLTPIAKINPSYLIAAGATGSSKQISSDLIGASDINYYRLYVLLRSLRLAAFVAIRF